MLIEEQTLQWPTEKMTNTDLHKMAKLKNRK
jgi:hypothetical protein